MQPGRSYKYTRYLRLYFFCICEDSEVDQDIVSLVCKIIDFSLNKLLEPLGGGGGLLFLWLGPVTFFAGTKSLITQLFSNAKWSPRWHSHSLYTPTIKYPDTACFEEARIIGLEGIFYYLDIF